MDLEYLDEIVWEVWVGDYKRVGVLLIGEVLYVVFVLGCMWELVLGDFIVYVVDCVGFEVMVYMLEVWCVSI